MSIISILISIVVLAITYKLLESYCFKTTLIVKAIFVTIIALIFSMFKNAIQIIFIAFAESFIETAIDYFFFTHSKSFWQ